MRKTKHEARLRRQRHIRKTVRGNAERPRLCVYRSLNHIYAQVIDDEKHAVLCAISSLEKGLRDELKGKKKRDQAKELGKRVGKLCQDNGVSKVVFDRNGFRYHGRVKAVADGARESGLSF